MMIKEFYTLNNGVKIPKIALGTWQVPNDIVDGCILMATKNGYRHIDTAFKYKNEVGVGKGIKECGINRSELFITTKISDKIKTYEGAKEAIDLSLENLGLDYMDLCLIHAPRPYKEMIEPTGKTYNEENLAVWKAMEEAYHEGKIRALGVSNFSKEDIDNLLQNATIKPTVNQIKVHIGFTPIEIMDYCKENDILIEAFSPNATGKLFNYPEIMEMAKKYNVTVPQLCIRYDLQLGCIVLPKTTHEEYMIQNADVNFEISEEDMQILKAIKGDFVALD